MCVQPAAEVSVTMTCRRCSTGTLTSQISDLRVDAAVTRSLVEILIDAVRESKKELKNEIEQTKLELKEIVKNGKKRSRSSPRLLLTGGVTMSLYAHCGWHDHQRQTVRLDQVVVYWFLTQNR